MGALDKKYLTIKRYPRKIHLEHPVRTFLKLRFFSEIDFIESYRAFFFLLLPYQIAFKCFYLLFVSLFLLIFWRMNYLRFFGANWN